MAVTERNCPFALGAMTFGEDPPGAGSSVEESEKILATYLDRGGNFVDTANFYTNGHSERILGDFFAARPGTREHVVLASKFFGNMFPGDPNGGGAGRGAIIAQLEQTLRRLRTDHLDLYYLHTGIGTPRSRRPCAQWTTWYEWARSGTWVSPTCRPGPPRRPRRWPNCGPGRR
ncbi:MAG TPA: aldo/keto reductase [Streptosporangiaceae bacterium]|jgi:aryl-alcohol dehydrogenase-like predicted oxidoreductase